MKEISIEIPEAQVPFMMELLQKFNFVKITQPPPSKKVGWKATGKALIGTLMVAD